MKLNEFQQAAVSEPPKNITVSAAAGSGKTQVLGARVLERISGPNPVPVNRLLIVTFTRAAAAEMRERISRSVTEALKNETSPQKKSNLRKQLSLLGGADICTIDSFCSRVLRQYFYRIPGLSGDFSLGDEGAVKLITAQCFNDITEMFSAAADKLKGKALIPHYEKEAERFLELYPEKETAEKIAEGFRLLAMNYGSPKKVGDFSDDSGKGSDYGSFVFKLKDMALSMPDPNKWLDMCIEDYDPNVPSEKSRVNAYSGLAAAKIMDDVSYMLEEELRTGGLNEKNSAVFTLGVESVRSLKKPESYGEAAEVFALRPLAGLRIQSKDTSKAKGNPHGAEVMKNARKLWSEAEKIFCGKKEDFDLFRREIYPAVLALCELARCLIRAEREEFIRAKKLSFSACVSLALELLVNKDGSPSETAMELRELYDEIYVDEAQDIDPRQQAIFDAISKGNLFMVGDVKQSIYGFRHAEPEIFNKRCFTGENSRLITMNINYRSGKVVTDAVNGVFSKLMNERTMGVSYDSMHRMIHGENRLPPESSKAEFIAVVEEETGVLGYDFQTEARMIASEINRLLREKPLICDKASGELRPIMKKDILVLMRSVRRDGPAMEKILEESGIACYFDGGESLYLKEETSAVIDVLSIIDNPERDIPLAGVLRGLMFGFSENDLLKLRTVSKSHSFSGIFAALSRKEHPLHEEYAKRLNDEALLARCLFVGKSLEKWRTAAAFRPVSEVISMILNDTEYYASVGAMRNGEKRRANLNLLTDEAERFEESGSKGLYSFLSYIKKQRPSGGGSLEAKTLSDSMDVVRIMSIHKSKGLEAPVVILAKCSAKINSPREACPVSAELGFSIDFINEDKGFIHKSPMSRVIDFYIREKERMEEMRLLYVAMTRARERLICTGYFKSEKQLSEALSCEGSISSGEGVFLRDSYAKMIGSEMDGSAMSLRRISSGQISPPALGDMLIGAAALNESTVENFTGLLGFSYGHTEGARLPAKLSVSAIKEADADENAQQAVYGGKTRERLRTPSFILGKKELAGAELGSVYHLVMERLDFSRPAKEQIDEMLKSGLIPSEAEGKIDPSKIERLSESPLGVRMRNAKELYREAPFMIKLPAKDILPLVEASSDDEIAVQGIIDCFFVENDSVVIVDYKTDRYTSPQEIAEKYKKQLQLYSEALKIKFFDKKIEKYLYLFFKGDIISI